MSYKRFLARCDSSRRDNESFKAIVLWLASIERRLSVLWKRYTATKVWSDESRLCFVIKQKSGNVSVSQAISFNLFFRKLLSQSHNTEFLAELYWIVQRNDNQVL